MLNLKVIKQLINMLDLIKVCLTPNDWHHKMYLHQCL